MLRVIFMGTPTFALPALDRLAADGYNVVSVVTQPDRPVGREGTPQPSPVKRRALELRFPVMQPAKVRATEVIEEIRRLAPDAIVVAAFGQMLPPALLEIPPLHCINVHASLLPRWRGAAPIAAAILAGDKETGVTIMLMEAGLDTGPILARRAIPIEPRDATRTLTERLALLGADLLSETLPKWARHEMTPRPQPEEGVTVVNMFHKKDGLLDWQRPADELDRRCRAFDPWPGCYTLWRGKTLKLLAVSPQPDWRGETHPGEAMFLVGTGSLAIATGGGTLLVHRLQLEGGRPLSAEEFLRGHPTFVGARLGE